MKGKRAPDGLEEISIATHRREIRELVKRAHETAAAAQLMSEAVDADGAADDAVIASALYTVRRALAGDPAAREALSPSVSYAKGADGLNARANKLVEKYWPLFKGNVKNFVYLVVRDLREYDQSGAFVLEERVLARIAKTKLDDPQAIVRAALREMGVARDPFGKVRQQRRRAQLKKRAAARDKRGV